MNTQARTHTFTCSCNWSWTHRTLDALSLLVTRCVNTSLTTTQLLHDKGFISIYWHCMHLLYVAPPFALIQDVYTVMWALTHYALFVFWVCPATVHQISRKCFSAEYNRICLLLELIYWGIKFWTVRGTSERPWDFCSARLQTLHHSCKSQPSF